MITWEEFKTKKKYWVWAGIIVIVLCIICGGRDDRSENKNEYGAQNVITITGHGEVKGTPDIANVYFTVRKEAKTVAEAQTKLAEIVNKSLEMLRANGIKDPDIKTESKSFNPKYEYRYNSNSATCMTNVPCPPIGNNVVVGYEAYQSTTVKIRNIDNTGKIIEELGKLGVTDLSGPNFAIDKEDALKEQARSQAIMDAKTKAKVLAKELGIRLGKMTSYNENGNYPMPMYALNASPMAKGMDVASAPAQTPVGENTISSDVTITYEIR